VNPLWIADHIKTSAWPICSSASTRLKKIYCFERFRSKLPVILSPLHLITLEWTTLLLRRLLRQRKQMPPTVSFVRL